MTDKPLGLDDIIMEVRQDTFTDTVGDLDADELHVIHTALEQTLVRATQGPTSPRFFQDLAHAEAVARTERVVRAFNRSRQDARDVLEPRVGGLGE